MDWDGNGKIDPVDIGITMSMIDGSEKPHKKKRGGCLTSMVITLCIISCLVWVVGSVLL